MSGDLDRAGELFLEVVDLDPGERAARLDQACDDDPELRAAVEQLLAGDRAEPPMLSGTRVGPPTALVADALAATEHAQTAELPSEIAGLRVVRELGRGGMGVVFEVEQDHPRRRLALKLLPSRVVSDDQTARFEREIEALAKLTHPGIARIHDAGTTDEGRPYFTMELVRGREPNRYARDAELDLRERMLLIARVCDAVGQAHDLGIVHRDLKPANVLVEDGGAPKVLDFGIARFESDTSADPRTLTGQVIGTLETMAPEQAAGDRGRIDARADVYALGAMLHELLVGSPPVDVRDKPLHEAVRAVCEDEPTRLGLHDARLAGDPETIVRTALAKEPERRYADAHALAADLRACVEDRPIAARPPSSIYQLTKFARRNRGVMSGLALAFMALVTGTVISTSQYVQARDARAGMGQQRDAALENLAAADQVTEFLVDLFEVPDTGDGWGAEVTARELLDRGVERIGTELADQPRIRARLMGTMGRVYGNLGLYAEARPLLEEALRSEREHGDASREALLLYQLGRVDEMAGEFESGRGHMRGALELLDAVSAAPHPGLPRILNGLAGLEIQLGEHASAATHLERAAALNDSSDPLTRTTLDVTRVRLLADTDRPGEALELAQQVLAARSAALPDDHPDVLAAMALVADQHLTLDEIDAMLALQGEIHALATERLDPEHPRRLAAAHDYAIALQQAGRRTEAEPLLIEHLERARAVYGEDNPRTAAAYYSLGNLQWELGRFEPAESNLRRALALREALLGPEHPRVASTLNTLATLLTLGLRRPAEAIPLYERAVAITRASLGPDVRGTLANILSGLAGAYSYSMDLERAEEVSVELLALYRELYGENHLSNARTLHSLSVLAFQRQDLEQCLDHAEQCRAVHDALLPADHPDRAFNLDIFTRVFLAQQRFEEAEATAIRSLELRRAGLPPGNVNTAESEVLLAECLLERGAFEEAEPLVLGALETARAVYPPGHPQIANALGRVHNVYRRWGRTAEAERFLELFREAGGR